MSNFKRRDFIKNTVMAGFSASILKVDPLLANDHAAFKSISRKTTGATKRSLLEARGSEDYAVLMN